MAVLLMLCLPIVAIAIWAVAYDLRHRKDPVTGHDPRRAAMRTPPMAMRAAWPRPATAASAPAASWWLMADG